MSSLSIPEGLKVSNIVSEELNPKHDYLEYLEFSERKIAQITNQVIYRILEEMSNGRTINLIVPLNGGLIFYRYLMQFAKSNFDMSLLNVTFCDEDISGELCFSANPINVETACNIAIDDIWDKGGTGKEIFEALSLFGPVSELDFYAFCRKESSPDTNSGARIANSDTVAVFPDEWLHGWGGMNSGKFKGSDQAAVVTALERTSFLPLIPTGEKPIFNPEDFETIEQYMDLLTQTNLAVNGVIPIEVYEDVLFLERNSDLRTRFNYLLNIHAQYTSVKESIEVEG